MPASIASDYAVLRIGNIRFYYGYEATDDKGEWCFSASDQESNSESRFTIPQSKLNVRDKWNCAECLMDGIEQYFKGHWFELREPV